MPTVIKAENLSKLYYLGGAKSDSLRDAVMSFVKKPSFSKEKDELWALRDVSFDVREGETVGIIGNNGAGKSTLLKILSRITKPTAGTVELHGRVGSLLEVGTGFHNELTGRENIFLNGAILGMKRSEIERQFDEIVAFSEVEKFLDTPVKHFSSGMYMRLAFAVAAHLDPEILIVDEVLAVGDANFQRKCLSKMKDVSQSGRTVLFVSHDMAAITRICSRAIALNNGEIVLQGDATQVVREYLHSNLGMSAERDYSSEKSNVPASEYVRLTRVRVVDENGETCSAHDIRRRIGIEATYEALQSGQILTPNFQIYNQDRVQLFTVQDVSREWRRREKETGKYTSRVWIPPNFMAEGTFFVNFAVVTYLPAMRIHFNQIDAVSFDVVDSLEGDTARGDYAGKMDGVIRPILEWETSFKDEG
ncbi:MAG: ABC transporter ATP-binding protein [Acidobacteriota bacterium]|nr:ABC transporter ATP-binding protein [Acidobacteriota bacterium]